MITPEDIKHAHYEYLQHLSEQDSLKRTGESRMRASELGNCEFAVAQRRLRFPVTHPDAGRNHPSMTRMHQGRITGEVWAQAMDFYFKTKGFRVQPELPLASDELVGQADIVLFNDNLDGESTVVEIKNTAYWQPQPKHFLQLGAYMKMADAQHGFLVYQRPDFTIEVFEAARVDEHIEARMAELDSITTEVSVEGLPLRTLDELIPGFCCDEKKEKTAPYKYRSAIKPGHVTVRCPFFGNCYAIPRSAFYTTDGPSGLQVADEWEALDGEPGTEIL